MSVVLFVKPEKQVSVETFNESISTLENLKLKKEDDKNEYFYWLDKKSTRGVWVNFEDPEIIEVTIHFMANEADYEMANRFVKKLTKLTNGTIYTEFGEEVISHPVFDKKTISWIIKNDITFLLTMMADEETPLNIVPSMGKPVYFGQQMLKNLKNMSYVDQKRKIFETIHNVSYNYPDYEYGTVFNRGINGSEKVHKIKLLTNEENILIKKYDYLVFHDGEQYMFITNDVLNSILPKEWILLDEYNVVAPILDEETWVVFMARAKECFTKLDDGEKISIKRHLP